MYSMRIYRKDASRNGEYVMFDAWISDKRNLPNAFKEAKRLVRNKCDEGEVVKIGATYNGITTEREWTANKNYHG